MTVGELIKLLDDYGHHVPVAVNVHDEKPLEGIADVTYVNNLVEIVVSDDPADRPER